MECFELAVPASFVSYAPTFFGLKNENGLHIHVHVNVILEVICLFSYKNLDR